MADALPQNMSELLSGIEHEWKELWRAVARLTPEQMVAPDAGAWSPRDNLAHLDEWRPCRDHALDEQAGPAYLRGLALSRWLFWRRLSAVCSLLPAMGSASYAANPQSKPNIIFVLTDDLDVESTTHMPKLQAFVSNVGVTFSNSFAANPVCCPSRASTPGGTIARVRARRGGSPSRR